MIHFITQLLHPFFHLDRPLDPLHGDGYQVFSGPLGATAVFTGMYVFVRARNCHVKRCARIGRHPVEGTTYTVCRRHHPDDKPTVEDVHAAHEAAKTTS